MERQRQLRGVVSVNCLPDLISEIDAMRNYPTPEQRREIIARYQEKELRSRNQPHATIASSMINEYLLEVLWLTRKYRRPENKGKKWQS